MLLLTSWTRCENLESYTIPVYQIGAFQFSPSRIATNIIFLYATNYQLPAAFMTRFPKCCPETEFTEGWRLRLLTQRSPHIPQAKFGWGWNNIWFAPFRKFLYPPLHSYKLQYLCKEWINNSFRETLQNNWLGRMRSWMEELSWTPLWMTTLFVHASQQAIQVVAEDVSDDWQWR